MGGRHVRRRDGTFGCAEDEPARRASTCEERDGLQHSDRDAIMNSVLFIDPHLHFGLLIFVGEDNGVMSVATYFPRARGGDVIATPQEQLH